MSQILDIGKGRPLRLMAEQRGAEGRLKRAIQGVLNTDLTAGCSKRSSSKAAGGARTGGVPSGYVEDSCELRTKLDGFFNSLSEVVLRHAISKSIPRDLEEPAGF